MSRNIDWTPLDAELTRLHATGIPFREIGKSLGVTRNAAIGRAGRLGLTSRKPGSRRQEGQFPRSAKLAQPRPAAPTTAISIPKPSPAPAQTCPPVRLENARGEQCRFPLWADDGNPDFLVCGAPGYPWCEFHKRQVFSQQGKKAA